MGIFYPSIKKNWHGDYSKKATNQCFQRRKELKSALGLSGVLEKRHNEEKNKKIHPDGGYFWVISNM